MTWFLFGLLLKYGALVAAVVSTAPVWGPLLLGVLSLARGVRRAPSPTTRRVRTPRGHHPDTSQRGDCGGRVSCADTDPDVSAGTCPEVSEPDDDVRS